MTKLDQNRLTERQKKSLPYFLSSSSEAEACRLARISKQSYYSWLKDPIFRTELSRLRDLAVETLKTQAETAVHTLIGLLTVNNPIVRRNAANDILSHVFKFKELQDIEMRIQKLENEIESDLQK